MKFLKDNPVTCDMTKKTNTENAQITRMTGQHYTGITSRASDMWSQKIRVIASM